MAFDPGRLDQRVTIQQESRATDDEGGAAVTWVDVATVWASIRAKAEAGGAEPNVGDRLQSATSFSVAIRRRSDVTASMRIVWVTNGSKVLNILSVNDEGPRAEFQFMNCELGVAT